MSKSNKAAAAAAAAATAIAPPPPFRPPPIPLSTLLYQAHTDSLLPNLVHSAVNTIVHTAINRLYHAGIERAAEQYVAQQAVLDVLSVVEWQSVERDEGEEKWIAGWEGMTAEEEAERLKHLWVPEDEPLPCAIDRWARHVLPVATHDVSSSDLQPAEAEATAVEFVSPLSDDGAAADTASAHLDSTAPFSVMSVNTSTSTFTSPALHTRSVSVRPTKPHRVLSPSTAARPPPSVTSTLFSSQPAALATSTHSSSSLPYPLPSSSPPAASEQQRLALMATLRQQQADMAEKKRKEKERIAEEEKRREEERAKERALMSARRQKAATLQSARLPAADSATTPARKQPLRSTNSTTQQQHHEEEEKQQLAASPTSPRSTLPALRNSTQRPAVRPANPKRATKQAIDESTVDGYTGVAALMASIVKSFVPAAGVRLVYGSEVKAGSEVGGGSGGEGRGRGVSVEDEQWGSVVRGMNRSQYMRWMDEQRGQAAKEADIQLRQHSKFAPTTTAAQQPLLSTQPTPQQHHRQPTTQHHHDDADHHSTPLPQPLQPPARLRLDNTEHNEEKVQLTARTAVVLQPRVVTRERRELSFDSRIIADSGWGSNNGGAAGRNNHTHGVGYDRVEQAKSNSAVKARKAVVSVPRTHKSIKATGEQQIVVQQSKSGAKVRASSAGQVKVVADKNRIAALLQLGKGRELGTDVADGEQ